jgi:hypothetical protein
LTLWANDLPPLASDARAGFRKPGERYHPRISLAEKRDGDRAFGHFSAGLVDVIVQARSLAIESAAIHGLPTHQKRFGNDMRLRSGCISNIPILGLNLEETILSREELAGARREVDPIIPVLTLGPVRSALERDNHGAKLRYGHITRG